MSLCLCFCAIASRGCQAQHTLARTFEKASRASRSLEEPTERSALVYSPAANWRRGQASVACCYVVNAPGISGHVDSNQPASVDCGVHLHVLYPRMRIVTSKAVTMLRDVWQLCPYNSCAIYRPSVHLTPCLASASCSGRLRAGRRCKAQPASWREAKGPRGDV